MPSAFLALVVITWSNIPGSDIDMCDVLIEFG
jgi:hypothetical protein